MYKKDVFMIFLAIFCNLFWHFLRVWPYWTFIFQTSIQNYAYTIVDNIAIQKANLRASLEGLITVGATI